jgi:hypothetical protein
MFCVTSPVPLAASVTLRDISLVADCSSTAVATVPELSSTRPMPLIEPMAATGLETSFVQFCAASLSLQQNFHTHVFVCRWFPNGEAESASVLRGAKRENSAARGR